MGPALGIDPTNHHASRCSTMELHLTPLRDGIKLHIFISQIILFITYEEHHNNGHIYRRISHVCHNKIVCPLANFVACDWLW